MTTTQNGPVFDLHEEALATQGVSAAQTARIPRALVPPFTGRLHCGRPSHPVTHTVATRTALHRAAPLRPGLPGIQRALVGARSYRPSPGGSIAASGDGTPGLTRTTRTALHRAAPLRLHRDLGIDLPNNTSYRPSPGGSIAATSPSSTASYAATRTALHRAAPLRRCSGRAGRRGYARSYRPSPGGSIAADKAPPGSPSFC